MSIITVQLGQCGNQVADQLFNTIVTDANQQKYGNITAAENRRFIESEVERFFFHHESESLAEAKSVMVDMETKVISQLIDNASKTGLWRYPKGMQLCQKSGSGNNWAYGYCHHGPSARHGVLEMIRHVAEKCDSLSGFLVFLSLAGGTGSGVGAYINECIRDEFRHKFIMDQVIWPYKTGEVIVQNYNAMLTLSHLYQSSDAILAVENDLIHDVCSRRLHLKHISLHDMNKVICHQLAAVLVPAISKTPCGFNEATYSDMLSCLISQPDFKLLTLRSIPQVSEKVHAFSTHTWPSLMKPLRQMLIADSGMEDGIDWSVGVSAGQGSTFNKSISNLLVLRGNDSWSVDTSRFSEPALYVPWIPAAHLLTVWSHERSFNNYEKCAALLSNSQAPVKCLNRTIQKAWNMFAAKAYVHQYEKHGLGQDDFLDAFIGAERILMDYKNI